MSMVSIKGITYKMEYTPVHFNFKTKKVEFELLELRGDSLNV
jgi:hypothetical protein